MRAREREGGGTSSLLDYMRLSLSTGVRVALHLPAPPQLPSRRVVVTGIGLVTPLGCGTSRVWKELLAGAVAVHALEDERLAALPCRLAAQVPRGTGVGEFDATAVIPAREARTASAAFVSFALGAAREAVADARLDMTGGSENATEDELEAGKAVPGLRFGVAIGSGVGGIDEASAAAAALLEPAAEGAAGPGDYGPVRSSGVRRLSPFLVPRILCNSAAGAVALLFGCRGPQLAPAAACAAGAQAIGEAFRLIKSGAADVMLAGGTEACVGPLALAGFGRARALASGTRAHAEPSRASRPFDAARDGFVLGEGAGVLVLEERDRARARGAHIYAELRGYGCTSDAHHVTAPAPGGGAALRCMRAALAEGGLDPAHVDYVNAHATSTPLGDAAEAAALGRLFADRGAGGGGSLAAVSSTKGAIGHLLGAAGAVEAAFAVLAVARGEVPPTANLDNLDPALPTDVCDFVRVGDATRRRVRAALSNSFGFGGVNSSLLFAEDGGDEDDSGKSRSK